MADTKPKFLWHADGEGKCHVGCEQIRHYIPGCGLLNTIPWTLSHLFKPGDPCPFAVLADALALHERDPKPDEDRRCGTCAEYRGSVNTCSVTGQPEDDSGPPWPNCRFWRRR